MFFLLRSGTVEPRHRQAVDIKKDGSALTGSRLGQTFGKKSDYFAC
jgi:hypothetical protein